MEKLTTEEQATRAAFIADWVDSNRVLPDTLRLGVQTTMTVQDICNSGVKTLQRIGQALKERASKSGDEDFGDAKPFEINGYPGDKIITFIRLTIRKKKAEEVAEKKSEKIADLKARQKSLATPEELRAEIAKELAELEA